MHDCLLILIPDSGCANLNVSEYASFRKGVQAIIEDSARRWFNRLRRFNSRLLSPFEAGAKVMSRERKSNKETKKKPGMTAKEKKAAKKAKKDERGRIGE